MPNNASLKNDVETDLASLALSPRMNPQVKKVRPKFPFDRSWLSHEEAEDEGCTRHGDIGSPLSASAVAHQTFPTPLSPCMWPCDSPKADLGDIHGLGFQELHTSKVRFLAYWLVHDTRRVIAKGESVDPYGALIHPFFMYTEHYQFWQLVGKLKLRGHRNRYAVSVLTAVHLVWGSPAVTTEV